MEASEKLHNALRNWYTTFLNEFRSRLRNVPEHKKPIFLAGNDFQFPCQILVFWVIEPQYQDVVIIRDPRLHDDAIRIYGPVSLATMSAEAEKMINDPWFEGVEEPARSELNQQYKKIIEDNLLGLVGTLPQIAAKMPSLARNQVNIIKRAAEKSTHFTWAIFGNLLYQNPLELAAKTINDPLTRYEEMERQSKIQKPTDTATIVKEPDATKPGFLSGFYPPIWLGEKLTFRFRERLDGIFIPPWSKILRLNYKGRRLYIMRNGLLTITEPDRANCLNLLNEIMCTAFLLGIPSTAVRDDDVSEALIYETGRHASYYVDLSERTRQTTDKQFNTISEEEFSSFRVIDESDLKHLVETSERCTQSDLQTDYAKWFINSHTYWEEAEYDHSITRSWLIIEKHARSLWIKSQGELLSGMKGATVQSFPPMKKLLARLFKASRLTEDDYHILDRMREQRNDLLHEGRTATREEAATFLTMGENITRETMGIPKSG